MKLWNATEYENLNLELLKDNEFKNQLLNCIKHIKTTENLIPSSLEAKNYLIKDNNENCTYLLAEEKETTSIYRTDKAFRKDALEQYLNGEENFLNYFFIKILTVFNEDKYFKKQEKDIDKHLDIYPDELKKHLRKTIIQTMNFKQEFISSNPYELKKFFKILQKNQKIKFKKSLLTKNTSLFETVSTRIEELGNNLKFIEDVLKENKFTAQNKYEFNDMDNHIWKNGKYIVFKEQNFSFVIDFKDAKNFIVYVAIDKCEGHQTKCLSLSHLLKDVKSSEKLDPIDYVALEVKQGQVEYVNNAFIYSLDFNIMLNFHELQENFKKRKSPKKRI